MNTRLSRSRYRWQITARVFIAALGGYAFTSVLSIWLALLWPLPRAQAVLAASMLSFVWYAASVIWVFSVRSVMRAALGLLIPTLVFGGWSLWLMSAGRTP